MPINYKPELTRAARELRRNSTRQEKHLWYDFLKGYPIRFFRQKPIDSFIADFYCQKAKLVIEIDGGQHYSEQGLAYDFERTKIFEEYGIKVIRFTNDDVNKNFDSVCFLIDKEVKERMGE